MKFLLPSAGLYPLPLWLILRFAKKAGFDGVEVFLFGKWTSARVERLLNDAADLNLIIHFHQVWSTDESSDGVTRRDRILTALGQLPKSSYRLEDIVPPNARPLVAYADVLRGRDDGYWVQTLSTGPIYKVPFEEFKNKFMKTPFPIVLDTQHIFEYISGAAGVSRIGLNKPQLLERFAEVWKTFGQHVQEIHFNDFDPSLGNAKGRNVFPGTGVNPLVEMAQLVMNDHWDGFMVPEVFLGWNIRRVQALRSYLGVCFE